MGKMFLLLGALTSPVFVLAQQSVANPAVPVPAVSYRSVFANVPTGVETQSVDWKAANAEVGQFTRGHVDILKWEQGQAGGKADARAPGTAPASAPAPVSPAAKP